MTRTILAITALVVVCAATALARDTVNDGNDSPGKFDFAKFTATYAKQAVTVKFTLYDDVVDADFTMKDAATPEEDGAPMAFDGLKGNRLCAWIERRVSPDKFPKYVLACTGRVVDGRLTGRMYRQSNPALGIKGRGVAIDASRSGKVIKLVIAKSKLPKAKTSRSKPVTRYIGPGCANPCYDLQAGGEGAR